MEGWWKQRTGPRDQVHETRGRTSRPPIDGPCLSVPVGSRGSRQRSSQGGAGAGRPGAGEPSAGRWAAGLLGTLPWPLGRTDRGFSSALEGPRLERTPEG